MYTFLGILVTSSRSTDAALQAAASFLLPPVHVLSRAVPMRWDRQDRKKKLSITGTQVSPITNSTLYPCNTLQKKHLAHSSLRYNKSGYSGAPLSPQNSFDIQTLEANT